MDNLLAFTPYGIRVALALLLGIVVAALYMNHKRHPSLHVLLTFGVAVVPCTFLVSRLFFILANSTYYLTTLSKPSLALRFWDGGYAMTGAFAGACLGAVLAAKAVHLSPRLMLDAVGLGFPAAAVAARLAEIGTGLGEGREVTCWIPPLAPEGYDGYLHPVFLYEALAALVIFLLLLALSRSHHQLPHEGDLLLMSLLLYGICEIFLESLKDDGHMVVHFVRIQQVLALLMVLITMVIWARRVSNRKTVVLSTCLTLICIGLAVFSEFGVDRWGNRLLAYGLMLSCLLIMLLTALHLYHLTLKELPRNGKSTD